jgi:hypothetical protein
MKKFSSWVREGKETVVSSPIKGANQDQSGNDTKRDTADYSISDSKKCSKCGKSPCQCDTVKESAVSGVGNTRIKPVNMAQSTGGSKAANAPSNAASLQNAANHRVAQLDAAAQKEKNDQEKERERQQKEREQQQKANQAKAVKPAAAHEEVEIDEGRGRPKKNPTSEDPGSDNIIDQLRRVITLRGQKPVKFVDGKQSSMSPGTAHRLLAMYDNLRTSGEKHQFTMRIHKSADSMRDVLAGKKEVEKPKVSLAGGHHGDNSK